MIHTEYRILTFTLDMQCDALTMVASGCDPCLPVSRAIQKGVAARVGLVQLMLF